MYPKMMISHITLIHKVQASNSEQNAFQSADNFQDTLMTIYFLLYPTQTSTLLDLKPDIMRN